MKRELHVLCLLILASTGITVIMESKEEPTLNAEDSMNFNEAFGSCLSRKEYGTFECMNRGALSALQSLNQKDDLDFGEVHLERADGYGRELLDWDYDPKDFGNIIKAATRLMERRSLKWNLDNLYPGLQLQAGPMLNGNGILEFVVNERVASYSDRQGGPEQPAVGSTAKAMLDVLQRVFFFPGRQLARHLLLPFLLGFKFNLASLIPLLFGFLLLVTKKALLLTKVALFISGLLGWNSLTSVVSPPQSGILNGYHGFHSYGHETPVTGFPYYDHHHFPNRPYRGPQDTEFNPYGQHIIREVVNVYGSDGAEELAKNKRTGKNFVWAKDE